MDDYSLSFHKPNNEVLKTGHMDGMDFLLSTVELSRTDLTLEASQPSIWNSPQITGSLVLHADMRAEFQSLDEINIILVPEKEDVDTMAFLGLSGSPPAIRSVSVDDGLIARNESQENVYFKGSQGSGIDDTVSRIDVQVLLEPPGIFNSGGLWNTPQTSMNLKGKAISSSNHWLSWLNKDFS